MKRDGMEVLIEAMITGDTGQAVINQEKRGQEDLIHTEVLPVQCIHGTREQLEEIGIVFGQMIDKLFIQATLPEGWKKEPTNHNMWSDLIDNKGRKRGMIFYKAAYYDRGSHMFLSSRFNATYQPVEGWSQEELNVPYEGIVTDCKEIIWRSDPMAPSEEIPYFYLSDHVRPLAVEWLEKRYPNWEDPLAYWEEEQ